jgi:hypothetical protein
LRILSTNSFNSFCFSDSIPRLSPFLIKTGRTARQFTNQLPTPARSPAAGTSSSETSKAASAPTKSSAAETTATKAASAKTTTAPAAEEHSEQKT